MLAKQKRQNVHFFLQKHKHFKTFLTSCTCIRCLVK